MKSGSLQRASRAVNSIGGGRPVSEYWELNESRTVLINVPDDQLAATVADLAAGVTWKHKTAILCNSPLDSAQFAQLEALGAGVGSFDAVAGFEGQRYVIEGSSSALREMRVLLNHDLTRVIEIRRGAKEQYLAGVAFATSLVSSMIVASVKSLRAAGIPLGQAHNIAAKLAEKSIRDYLKAGVAGSPANPGTRLQALADGLELANPGLIRHLLLPKPDE